MNENYKSALKVKKTNWALYGAVTAMALFFAWLIEKNAHIPASVILFTSIFALVIIFIAGVSNPKVAFFALTAYFPFNKVLGGDFGGFMTAINVTNILILIVMIGWFSKSFSSGGRLLTKNTLNLPIILFCLLGCASLVRGASFLGSSGYFEAFIIPLKRWLTPVFLFFLTVNVIKDREDIKKTTVIMMIAVTVAGLMAIYEYLEVGSNASLDKSRVGGICEQANMLGGFFVSYMFVLAAVLLMNWRSLRYYFLIFPLMTCVYGILVTFSRGAYLGLGMGLWTLSYFKNKFLWILVTIYLVASFLNPILLPAGIRYRMVESTFRPTLYDTGIEEHLEGSARSRLVVWRGAFEMIKDYPVFGVGYGLFPYLIPYYTPTGKIIDAHNTYLIIAAEMGIPTLIMFLMIFVVLIKNARFLYRKSKDKFIRSLALGVLAGVFGLLVVNIFGSRMNSEEVSAYFWILAGLVMRGVLIENADSRRLHADSRR